ncbi:MAG TPA: hypothetical protein VNE38_08045 [Ktedonobacteraceae bacterium]|nr:hypothetical protein [Ktedonobacteraceae bacterium]
MLTLPENNEVASSVMASLYIQAVRQGQSTWFRVISGSMRPILQIGDAVYIQPATLDSLQVGEIAAFETPDGLVIHRVAHIRNTVSPAQFLEMGDVLLRANWVDEQALVGRVTEIRRGRRLVNLQSPLAKRYGKITANVRYRVYCFYQKRESNVERVVLRKFSRLVARLGYLFIWLKK